MGIEDLLTPPTEEQTQTPPVEESTEGSSQQQEQTTEQQPQEQTPTDDKNKDNQVIRGLRDQIKQAKANETRLNALLQKIGNGATIEELEKKYQEEEDKRNAVAKGIPPEVETRIREQENRIKQLEEQNIAYNFNVRANALMTKENLNEQQFLTFFEDAKAAGIDIRNPNVNLETIYRAVYFDKLATSIKEQTRQSVLEEIENQKNRTPSPNKVNTPPANGNQSKDNLDTAGFMNELFSKFNKQ